MTFAHFRTCVTVDKTRLRISDKKPSIKWKPDFVNVEAAGTTVDVLSKKTHRVKTNVPDPVMSVIYFLLLSYFGLGITAQAQDCSNPVLGANMGLKDNDLLLQAFPNGLKVSLACDVGYVSAGGSSVITCTDGTWSPVRLKCERRNCGSPDDVQNGYFTFPQGTEFGDIVQISCKPGFTLVGKSELTCGARGWMGRVPVCEVTTCDPPPQIEDGAFNPVKDVYDYRDVVRYTCESGFVLDGSNSVSCLETGTWPDPPSCKQVQCDEPIIENADWVRGSRPPYKYKATVTYQCRSGYKMEGDATLICDINSNWTPKLPQCKPLNCSKPPEEPNMSLEDSTIQTFPHGSSVTYVCNGGYNPVGGSAVRTCSLGQWSAVGLKCQPKHCSKPVAGPNMSLKEKNIQVFQHGTKVTFGCDAGYESAGGSEVITCNKGTWSTVQLKCQRISTPTKPTTTATPPGNNGNVVGAVLGSIVGVVLICAIGCGVSTFMRKKRGNAKSHPGNGTTKSEEEVSLSDRREPNPAENGREAVSTHGNSLVKSEPV